MSAKVKAIIEVPYLPGTPARVSHLTGVIEVNKSHFDKLPKVYKEFVIQHECGHLELNTRDEFAADEYAMKALLKKGYPLTQILQSLTRVLSHENPQHYGRTVALFNKLRHYDYSTNNNKKVLTKFNPTQMNIPDQVVDVYSESLNPYSNFAWASLIPLAGDLLGGSSNNNAAAQQTAQQNAAMQAQLQAQQQQMQQMQLQQQMEAAARKADEPKEGNNDTLIIVVVIIVVLIIAGVVIFRTKKGGKK